MPSRKFKLSRVHKDLHDLIPLAQKWGVADDERRRRIADKATKAELKDVAAQLKDRHESIWRWLYHPRTASLSDEADAFTHLLVFEMEELDGPGCPGELDWRISEFKRDPKPSNRKLLVKAVENAEGWSMMAHIKKDLKKAKRLLADSK